MKLETCRRGAHVNRIEMRQSLNAANHRVTEEYHVCRFCKHERRHAVRRVVHAFDVARGQR
jgi:hypothetical protein